MFVAIFFDLFVKLLSNNFHIGHIHFLSNANAKQIKFYIYIKHQMEL
jgi:hypothetical protein